MSSRKREKDAEHIRVLHLITIFSLGGATENTLLSVEGLRTLGYDVRIATGPNISSEGSLFDRAERGGIPVEIIPELMRSIHPFYDLIAFFKILAVLKRGKYHIVHTHSSKAGLLGRVAAKLARVPIIVHTIHGLPFHDYQGNFIRRIFVLAEKIGAMVSDKIITVTHTISEKALAVGVAEPEQFVTVRSGFEMDQFIRRHNDAGKVRRELGLKATDLVVGKIARFSELKGHQYVLDVVPDVILRVPNAKFLFVGSGELESHFKKRVQESGIQDSVIFTGLVSQEQIASLIAIMNVVVHTSLLEGLARVLPQALAGKKPVVSFDIDGAHEVVKEGITGHLVPPRDRTMLADAIVDLLTHRRKARLFGSNGISMVRNEWTKEAMVSGINAVYEELLANKGIHRNRKRERT
jgi:glycosyltransferase involved in cell wall biosynthesis